MNFPRWVVALALLVYLLPGQAAEKVLRVAVLNHSPPMSYTDEAGRLTGFNVEVMYALCEAMGVKCEPVPVTLERVVDAVAAGEFDFAAVSLLSTPERRARVLMSKPYYRSISVWFARPGIAPGEVSTGVVRGGVQARYAQAHGWKTTQFERRDEIITALLSGTVEAALLPMATAVALRQDPLIRPLGLASTLLRDPQLAGDVCLSVNPRTPELHARLNDAIDRIKRDGRFDRINSRFIPFRLQ
ncbi:MAG: transporter substrate-binding domain-containing protein [Zoogloea sp.]|uniref:substrate-binding periplasmic protein n=1 Tax=Zoogloea sp. TaxID=49181 RepID=UPI002603F0FD|nr:transporter substrate-binding domain-containing protein [Zoogloea sp.]MDD2989261.1 transporter substrate-binding domain-containing protein [Zoogloea sp.]